MSQLDLFAEPVADSPEPDVVIERPEPRSAPAAVLPTSFEATVERVVETVDKFASCIGWAGAWRRVLDVLWSVVNRVGPGHDEARYDALIEGISADAKKHASITLAYLIQHFHVMGEYRDVLGPVHMRITSRRGQQHNGQFFTPWGLCMLAAQLNVPDQQLSPDGDPWTVLDPAVGSGSMLLAFRAAFAQRFGRVAAAQCVKVSGQDIDETACLMARIQLRLTDPFYVCALLQSIR